MQGLSYFIDDKHLGIRGIRRSELPTGFRPLAQFLPSMTAVRTATGWDAYDKDGNYLGVCTWFTRWI